MATPIAVSGRVMQYLGRILRPARGKSRALVYDYVDERVAPLAAAAKARQRVYGGAGETGKPDRDKEISGVLKQAWDAETV